MGLEVQASLEYYPMEEAMGRAHQNFVLYDTTSGETVIGRGMPSEAWKTEAKVRSVLNMSQKSETGKGNVKLKMDVVPGQKGVDPVSNKQTTTVPGSTLSLKDDMKTATAKLNQVAAQIAAKQIDYRLQTVNSNSAAGTAYNQVTGQAPPVETQLPIPGWNVNMLSGTPLVTLPSPPHYELSK